VWGDATRRRLRDLPAQVRPIDATRELARGSRRAAGRLMPCTPLLALVPRRLPRVSPSRQTHAHAADQHTREPRSGSGCGRSCGRSQACRRCRNYPAMAHRVGRQPPPRHQRSGGCPQCCGDAPRHRGGSGQRAVAGYPVTRSSPLPQMRPVSRARIHPKTPRSAGKLPSVRQRSRKGAKRLRLRQPGVASPEGASVDGHHTAAKRGEDPDGAAEAMKR